MMGLLHYVPPALRPVAISRDNDANMIVKS